MCYFAIAAGSGVFTISYGSQFDYWGIDEIKVRSSLREAILCVLSDVDIKET
jgi:hypothetical protein